MPDKANKKIEKNKIKESKKQTKQKISELKSRQKEMSHELEELKGETTKGKQDAKDAAAHATAKAEKEAKIKAYADAYAKMDPQQAANLFNNMTTGSLDLVAKTLENMPANKRAAIMDRMDVNAASQVTEKMRIN